MRVLDLIGLGELSDRTEGSADLAVGLIDGPVAVDHPDFVPGRIRSVSAEAGRCAPAGGVACQHGTFVAGVLAARRGSSAPAICPGCTLLVRPIFSDGPSTAGALPGAAPDDLAMAITECVEWGARLLNLSVGLARPSATGERALDAALDNCLRRGVLVVAAAGNQGLVGSSALTRHPWVMPVAACDVAGRPLEHSNVSASIGRRGLLAPGTDVTSLGSDGGLAMPKGTSVATPFVTGTAALLWSQFPAASAAEIKHALAGRGQRRAVVPPLLDAAAAYHALKRFGPAN